MLCALPRFALWLGELTESIGGKYGRLGEYMVVRPQRHTRLQKEVLVPLLSSSLPKGLLSLNEPAHSARVDWPSCSGRREL